MKIKTLGEKEATTATSLCMINKFGVEHLESYETLLGLNKVDLAVTDMETSETTFINKTCLFPPPAELRLAAGSAGNGGAG